MGIAGWIWGFNRTLPWTLWVTAITHLLLYNRDNFVATYQLLNCYGFCRMLQSLLPEYKIAPRLSVPLCIHLWSPRPFFLKREKEELRFPTEQLLHSRCWCSRGQGCAWSNSKLERETIRIWDVWRDENKYFLLYLATQINKYGRNSSKLSNRRLTAIIVQTTVLKTNSSHYVLTVVLAAENVYRWRRLTGAH